MIRVGKERHARHGRAGGGHGPLALVPMIDMLMILVVYLLVHSADTEILPNSRNIAIPHSASDQKPRSTTVVMVTRDTLYVNGAPVAAVSAVVDSTDPVVEPLRAALDAEAEPLLGSTAIREVTVMAEKTLPYALLRKIIASCAAADYAKVSLAVREREAMLAARTSP